MYFIKAFSVNTINDNFDRNIDPTENLLISDDCNYYTIDEFNVTFENFTNDYLLLNQNIQSFHSKHSKLDSFLESIKPKFHSIVLTETWNSADNVSLCYLDNYTAVHNHRESNPRRGGPGGGVSIFSKSNLFTMKRLDDLCFCTATIETCVAEVYCKNNNSFSHVIVGIYRPHSDSVENFNSALSSILSHDSLKHKTIIIAGDMNVNITASGADSIDEYLNVLSSFNFFPAITKPTRFTFSDQVTGSTTLDHIFINRILTFSSAIFSFDLSDHCGTAISLPLYDSSVYQTKLFKKSFRPYSENNFTKLAQKLFETNWGLLLNSEDVNSQFEDFVNYVNRIYCENFPIKSKFISVKRKNKPWITDSTLKLIRLKSVFYNMLKNNRITKAENNRIKNKLNKQIEREKNTYFQNAFKDARSNMKKSWSMLRSLMGTGTPKRDFVSIFCDGSSDVDNLGVLNRFNEFFATVGSEITSGITCDVGSPTSNVAVNQSSFFLYHPTETEILNIIANLKNTSTHIDYLPITIFKKLANILVKPLIMLIDNSFRYGIFPDILKIARITPIHKTGDFNIPSTYRPISSLPYYSKIYEKLMAKRLLSFCKKFKIITPEQYGFQSGISTCDALIKLTEIIYKSLDEKYHHIVTLIDIRKAFDCVTHEILLEKLKCYGIRGVPLLWFQSYLLDRKCYIQHLNLTSDINSFNTGVPQGSVLGPLLFLLFINDLPRLSQNFQTILFADDTTISTSGHDFNELVSRTNCGLEIISNWTKTNRLSLNTAKTELMIISNRFVDEEATLNFQGNIIHPTDSCKFLGVCMDNKLNFKNHIGYIMGKISRHTGILYKIKGYLPFQSRCDYYFSFIYPYLSYNVVVWGGSYASHVKPLVIQHKRVIRTMMDAGYRDPTSPLFKKLSFLKFDDIYKYNLLIYMFKARSRGEFTVEHGLNTRNRNLAHPTFHRLDLSQHAVSYAGPKAWNSLPINIQGQVKLGPFKRLVKQHLISQY